MRFAPYPDIVRNGSEDTEVVSAVVALDGAKAELEVCAVDSVSVSFCM
jgi:hypothetical protein